MICGLFVSRSVYPEELSMVECELHKRLWFDDRCCVAACVYVVALLIYLTSEAIREKGKIIRREVDRLSIPITNGDEMIT
jgi:hypothetical protein